MIGELFARLGNLRLPSTYVKDGYDEGWHKGYHEGQDIGKRLAYNNTLTHEINGVISRYSQLQVKLINHPKSEVQQAYTDFINKELDRFKMELQNR